jgi:flagellar protein FlaJ
MMYIEDRPKLIVFGASLALGIAIFSLAVLEGSWAANLSYMTPLSMETNNMITLAILVTLLPLALIEYNNNRWLREVDKNIPRLLMDVTESMRSGVSLFSALEVAAKRDYGPVSMNLESAMVNFRMDSDFEEAMMWLGEKLRRPNARRLVTILTETYDTGGKVDDILDTSIDMFTNLDEYREERDSQIGPYVLLVYIGALIFLIISWTIIHQFILPIVEMSSRDFVGESGILRNVLDINYYKSILYWASVIEGLAGGLVAGKIIHGRISGGLVHSVLLLVISFAFFNLLIV